MKYVKFFFIFALSNFFLVFFLTSPVEAAASIDGVAVTTCPLTEAEALLVDEDTVVFYFMNNMNDDIWCDWWGLGTDQTAWRPEFPDGNRGLGYYDYYADELLTLYTGGYKYKWEGDDWSISQSCNYQCSQIKSGCITDYVVSSTDLHFWGSTISTSDHTCVEYPLAIYDFVIPATIYGPVFPGDEEDIEDTIQTIVDVWIEDIRPEYVDLSGDDWGIWEFVKPTVQWLIDAMYSIMDIFYSMISFLARLVLPDINFFQDKITEYGLIIDEKFAGIDMTLLTDISFTTTQMPDIEVEMAPGISVTVFKLDFFEDYMPTFRTYTGIYLSLEAVIFSYNIYQSIFNPSMKVAEYYGDFHDDD